MSIRLGFIVLWALFIPLRAEAFSCVLTVVKDSCWADYDVTIKTSNIVTGKLVATVVIPKGETWSRQIFDCQAGQNLAYVASYQPSIWQDDAKKTYRGVRSWILPSEGTAKGVVEARELRICYTKDFSSTTLPPSANGHCQCDFSVVTPVKLSSITH